MADKEINDLTDGTVPLANDLAHIVRSGNSRKVKVSVVDQINAGTDEAFADTAHITARKADGTLLKRTWANIRALFLEASLLTTRGDMIRRGAASAERFAKGTLGKILRMGANDPDWDDQIILGATQASTSGSSINFTGIPAWAKRITILFNEVSTNGTAGIQVQIGDSGGLETTGYRSACTRTDSATNTLSTTGFLVGTAIAAAGLYSGGVTLMLMDAANFRWNNIGGSLARTDAAGTMVSSGTKALSAALDRLSIITTDTFDGGSISLVWE